MDKILMNILGLSTSPSSGGAYALVLSESDGTRRLPIIIGTFEAQAIALELEHIRPPRPMTHDLLRNIIQSFNSTLKYVFVNELKDGTFFAKIIIDGDSGEMEIDARPSDAIAIAIRFGSPIYVSSSILNEAGIVAEAGEGEEAEAAATITTEPAGSSSGKPQTLDEKLELLHKRLETAITDEDYERAAQIRDEINRLKQN